MFKFPTWQSIIEKKTQQPPCFKHAEISVLLSSDPTDMARISFSFFLFLEGLQLSCSTPMQESHVWMNGFPPIGVQRAGP